MTTTLITGAPDRPGSNDWGWRRRGVYIREMGAGEQIRREVTSWPGVAAESHRFGGVEYRLGRKEIGHVHGDHLADLPFTRPIRDELLAAGRAEIHHVIPDSGWVSRRIGDGTSAEVDEVISLFRINYDRYMAGMSPAAGTE